MHMHNQHIFIQQQQQFIYLKIKLSNIYFYVILKINCFLLNGSAEKVFSKK